MGNKRIIPLPSMTNKVVVITGANRGIGYHAARQLTQLGATCILACRNHQEGTRALQEIKEFTNSDRVHYRNVNLASLHSIKEFVSEFERDFDRLDVLINNATVAFLHEDIRSVDGIEMQFAVNYIAPFVLTTSFLNMFQNTATSRIINMNCRAHETGRIVSEDMKSIAEFHPLSYSTSKLLNMTFTNAFHSKYSFYGLNAFSYNPGFTNTQMYGSLGSQYKLLLKVGSKVGLIQSALDASRGLVELASREELDPSIRYWDAKGPVPCTTFTLQEEAQQKLWEMTEDSLKQTLDLSRQNRKL
jgi:retinol dehydrogenase-12